MSSYTDKMRDALFEQWDDDAPDVCGVIDSLNDEKMFRSFGEGLLAFIQEKEPKVTKDTAISYLVKCCASQGVPRSEIACKNTLKSWFRDGPRPNKGDKCRRSLFALSFALQLSPDETVALFHKVYLDRAFDFRVPEEVVYYYALREKLSWNDAERIRNTYASMTVYTNDKTIYTREMKADVDALKSEAHLLTYLTEHGHNFAKKQVSAKKYIQKLIDEAFQNIEEETELKRERRERKRGKEVEPGSAVEAYRNVVADSLNHLYEVIVGNSVRGTTGTTAIMKNARLPKEIKRRFPEAGTLSEKNPTYQQARNLIILLESYNLWSKWNNPDKEEIPTFDDYVYNMSSALEEHGFSRLYPGNPYDWLFMYCSLYEEPLIVFRSIIDEVCTGD